MTVRREIETVRSNAGIWSRADHTILQFRGKDAVAWLHGQTTNDIRGLASGRGNLNALLDRQGRVLCFFTAHRWEEEVWVIIEKVQVAALLDRIESHLFLEDVHYEDVGADTPQILIEGPRSLVALDALLAEEGGSAADLPAEPNAFTPARLLGYEVLAFHLSESGEDGYLIVPAPDEAEALLAALRERLIAFGVESISGPARDTLIFESGLPRFVPDIGAEVVIAETPLEGLAVNYEKGCYLGQEVVARLRAYATPKYYLTGLMAVDDTQGFPAAGTPLYRNGKRVGEMRRSMFAPTLGRWAAMAYLGRDDRTPGTRLTLSAADGTETFEAEVQPVPLYAPPERQDFARRLYDEALARFEADAADEDESSIEYLREALVLAPDFEDAYEALGVILHRHGRTDEAVEVMLRLADMNPDCVMAHTNLSVFYVAKGLIAEAEAEKAKAEHLSMKRALSERQAEKLAEEERARHRAEAEERIAMFQEVIEIDPEDPVATMGLGQAYIQLDRFADAIPWLETATRINKDYSAAWLQLGKCHEFLEHSAEARAAYEAGISAASRKGDLMPLREMERRLKALGAG